MSRHTTSILGDADGGFAEQVTYQFRDGSPERTFMAVVKRFGLSSPNPQARQVAKRSANIEIPRHATLGVLSVQSGDTITVALRIGDDATEHRIVDVVAQDDAMFVVRVEA
jgi:hypothetical protein